jgi:hypothetical protein
LIDVTSDSRLMVSRKSFEVRVAQAARGRSRDMRFSSMFAFSQVLKAPFFFELSGYPRTVRTACRTAKFFGSGDISVREGDIAIDKDAGR